METSKPAIFLTDYASYNNGTQFEFGHWVDLTQFNNAQELGIYISKHFEKCDKKSPLDQYGSKREETMITDFEGFPEEFYSESGCNFEKIFKYIEIDFENKSESEKVRLWNEFCSENKNSSGTIYDFDDAFFETFFSNRPMACARAAVFGSLNWSHDFIKFDECENLVSAENAMQFIDESELIKWLMEK
jgi:antirestriction protein